MFKKLRNRFLILNMLITSVIMIFSFAAIYLTLYNNIRMENDIKLETGFVDVVRPSLVSHLMGMRDSIINRNANNTNDNSDNDTSMNAIEAATAIPSFSISSLVDGENATLFVSANNTFSFKVTVDSDGIILENVSNINIEPELYEKIVRAAWNNQDRNKLNINNKIWQYNIKPSSGGTWLTTTSPAGGNSRPLVGANLGSAIGRYVNTETINKYVNANNNYYQIAFLDITESTKTLFGLLTTLILIGFLMLFVIFFVSLYFANRAITPIIEAWEKQKRFIADASHELKTPLSIINANYDALISNQEETIKSQQKWFGYMKVGTDRMATLISDLLSLAKVENSEFIAKKVSFDISAIVCDAVLSLEAVAVEKNIELIMSVDSCVFAKSDPDGIRQIISILLDNAIKYTNDGGKIKVSLYKQKSQTIFCVKNSGIGISEQDLPKIFDRFFRADSARTGDNESYGLGLSIAKTIADNLNIKIRVESVVDEYTIFSIIIP